ncbi:MAG: hypothetical protein KIS76_00545 [Pyrinomonadaceae bacterium]|nr:hypothetical protein [Pyrinomonadaceae bacterium]
MRVFIYLVLIFLGVFVLGTILLWIKDYIIRRNRKEDKKEDFIKHFVKQGISELLALDVYQYLQNWMSFNDFPVRPLDNLVVIYGIADEDLDDSIIEIAEANSYEIPKNTDYWEKQIVTVEDLIRFIDSFPRKKIYE